jgi:hypothetical protein
MEDPTVRIDELLEFLRTCGDRGATDRESAAVLGVSPGRIQNLRTNLVSRGQVKAAPTRRDGRHVWVWTEA